MNFQKAVASSLKKRLMDIIKFARENGQDPAQVLRDYLAEKDSRITQREAQCLVEILTDSAKDGT
jgi:hypothetical protein